PQQPARRNRTTIFSTFSTAGLGNPSPRGITTCNCGGKAVEGLGLTAVRISCTLVMLYTDSTRLLAHASAGQCPRSPCRQPPSRGGSARSGPAAGGGTAEFHRPPPRRRVV